MQSFLIQDIRSFMAKLLTDDTFDSFQTVSASVTTFCTWELDGRVHPQFDAQAENGAHTPPESTENENSQIQYVSWGRVRDHFYGLIRGKQSPLKLQVTFRLPDAGAARMAARAGGPLREADIGGLYLHVRFQEGKAVCVTGVSLKTFVPDKSLEHEWDAGVAAFLRGKGIPFEQE